MKIKFIQLKNQDSVKVFFLLALTTWTAHFWHSASFGLYADDYKFVARPMGMTLAELWDLILKTNVTFAQGRPVGFTIAYLLSFIGSKVAGLNAVYFILYVIVTINAFLFYTLLKRLFNQPFFTVTGVLAYCLFPADTTQAFLTHLLEEPALTFLFLAIHSYLSGNRNLSYLLILGSLLSYETVFPLFLAVPLMKKKWDSKRIRELCTHALVLAGMILCVVIIRKVTGETRVSNFELLPTLNLSLSNIVIGPGVSMSMFFVRSVQTLLTLKGELLVVLPLSFIGLMWGLSQLNVNITGEAPCRRNLIEHKIFDRTTLDFFQNLTKLALIGLIMLVLAYPLTLTLPATAINGRSSRVHFAAIVGASILCACICSAIMFVASVYRKKHLATAILTGFFTLLVGFGLMVQQDYRLSWEYQQAFWTDIIKLCPDITEGTQIVVERRASLKNPRQMDAFNTGFIGRVLEQIYQFPDDWKSLPRVYLLRKGWQDKLVYDENIFQLNHSTTLGQYDVKIKSSTVIWLEAKEGKLTRRNKPLIIGDKEFSVKKKPTSDLPSFKKGHLFDYLIRDHEQKPVNYIKQLDLTISK